MNPSVTSHQHIITATRITKSYGRRKVLDQLDLAFRKGGIYGITGENGSGKTTLMKILSGFMRPDEGQVTVYGKQGFCPQESLLFRNLTVDDNINFFCRAYGIPRIKKGHPADGHIGDLIHQFGFGEYRGFVCKHLSEGTLQKINLTLALLHDPDILLLDEPTSAFDWETYLRFWDYASKLRSKGKTILIVSHLLYDRDKIDEILKIEKGKLICG